MKENLKIETNKIENKKANSNLNKASFVKNDEFYTQLVDIENEIENYKNHFKDKVVYCNCDNPEWSNFFKYFNNNFDFLGLKKVITTYYEEGKQTYKLELTKHGKVVKTDLKGNGDFRNDECIEILKEADIVITNPPFSLFRDFIKTMIKYNKKFLVIGNMNSISYNEVFKHIKDNKLWLGISPKRMNFVLPNGEKKSINANWYTNIEHKKKNEELLLFKSYKGNELDYPKYDNFDYIEISSTKDIPFDYECIMGVPISFLYKYNPNQFEIIGKMSTTKIDEYNFGYPYINGKKKFARILIKNKNSKKL